jgi:hypothetical protein
MSQDKSCDTCYWFDDCSIMADKDYYGFCGNFGEEVEECYEDCVWWVSYEEARKEGL